jgi:predicted SnoaL-like aldol condensation-catalyzing enzyme
MRSLVFACSLAMLVSGAARAAEGPEDAAQAATVSWLQLVDEGRYAESWDQAAKLFTGAITKEQWEKSCAAVRAPLGKLVSRKLRSREYREQLPGAPDGKYVVIQFDTAFEKKASAVETVAAMLDADGVWRVSGYYIR